VRRLLRFGIVSLAVAALTACVSKLNVPTPPMQAETQAIAADYEMPSGTVDIAQIQILLGAINVKLPNLDLGWLPDLAANLLSSFNERLSQSGLPDDPDASTETHHFILSAVVDVHRICDGFANPPGPVDAANGAIDATAVVQDGRLQPEVWGVATGCQTNLSLIGNQPLFGGQSLASGLSLLGIQTASGNGTLDGIMIIYLLGPLPTDVSNARFLFTFNGQISVGNQTGNSAIDFRVFDGRLDFRIAVSDGNVVVETGTGSAVTLRGKNGTFVCDLTALSCQ
jgi:hypothetical protein